MAGQHPDPPREYLDKLRLVCLDLPDVAEEQAWTGTRWCIGKKNFAHAVMITDGWPPAYAKVAGTDGPLCVLTFRTPRPVAEVPRLSRPPYFLPRWWPDIAGMALGVDTDWDDVEQHLVASYCAMAPKKFAQWVQANRG